MSDGTTITRTTPLAELHPDAPITITRRQLELAMEMRMALRDSSSVRSVGTHSRKATERRAKAQIQCADWLRDLQSAAQQLQSEQVPA